METEAWEIRFGVAAVRMGFVSPDQTVRAMEIQVREDLSTGGHRPLGAILFDLGFISQSQLDEVSEHLDSAKNPE